MLSPWLSTIGYNSVAIAFVFNSVEEVLTYQEYYAKNTYYILTGMSKNKTNHCVVCKGGEIIWDTSLDDSGIIGPAEDGYYWIEYIIPISYRGLNVK